MLNFDPANHKYTWNGNPKLSATTCLKEAGLICTDWYTEQARTRGQLVHALTHLIDDGTIDEYEIDPEVQGYVDAYQKFLAENKVEWLLIEQPLYSPSLDIAGTPDRFGYVNGVMTLPDFKSGQIMPWVDLQTAIYLQMIAENLKNFPLEKIMAAERRALQLKSDGNYIFHPAAKGRNDFLIAKCAINVAKWKAASL